MRFLKMMIIMILMIMIWMLMIKMMMMWNDDIDVSMSYHPAVSIKPGSNKPGHLCVVYLGQASGLFNLILIVLQGL